jgi:hypothetical protein
VAIMSDERNPVLARLGVFLGEWWFDAIVDGVAVARARLVAEWQEDGAYLVQRAAAEPPLPTTPQVWIDNSPMPTTSVIGLDDTSETFTVLYSDARDVFRVYRMTLTGTHWTMWREAAGFHQRLTATVSDDATAIDGMWERSDDGTDWFVDFHFRNERIAAPGR